MNIRPSLGAYTLANAIEKAFTAGQTDYSLSPITLARSNGEYAGEITAGDTVIFCCRRGEREIELTEAFTDPAFPHFQRDLIENLDFVILTLYHEKFKDLHVAFAPQKIQNTLGEIISRSGLSQLRVAESEKFAHVTFFLNGGNSQPYNGEIDLKIPSPRGVPFEQVPELSLPEVVKTVESGIENGYNLIITNFANGDVIGHTSDNSAKIKCAQIVDQALATILPVAAKAEYDTIIIADHGNLEYMIAEDGSPHVAHTTSLVPFIYLPAKGSLKQTPHSGRLADVAPTILHLYGINPPDEMDGKNLLSSEKKGSTKQVLVIILDGWGFGPLDSRNPIHIAETPCWDELLQNAKFSTLEASGDAVGLKTGKAGNSEAGHLNIGAGRIVMQDDVRLDQAMRDNSFSTNPILLDAIEHAKSNQGRLHLIGLLTEKSSHGSIDYPLAILQMAKTMEMDQVCLHMILDGRSTEPGSAPALLRKVGDKLDEIGIGQVVSCIGRGLALDRDGNYSKIEKAYLAMTKGMGTQVRWTDGSEHEGS